MVQARDIVNRATASGVTLRLLGGMAVRTLCPSSDNPALRRDYKDLDFIGFKKEGRRIRELFAELGYTPDKMFNSVHGSSRLVFYDTRQKRIDIFLDYFDMCHKFDFRNRLKDNPMSLSATDILVTKLQVFQANEKDYKDIVTILVDHGVDEHSGIDGTQIAKLGAADWGIYMTFMRTLKDTSKEVVRFGLDSATRETVTNRIQKLQNLIGSRPKSTQWHLRAVIGEKSQWYKLPDETVESDSTVSG